MLSVVVLFSFLTMKVIMSRNPKGNQQVKKTANKPIGAAPHAARASNKLVVTIEDMITLEPLTDRQEDFFESYDDGVEVQILDGSPGTGKTMISLYKALESVLTGDGPHTRVVIVRSTLPTRDQGFLPGTAEEKAEVYEAPYHDICKFLFPRKPNAYTRLKEQGVIEFISTSYIRGTTMKDCIVLVDEMSNMTGHELESVFTRQGKNCRMILAGDYYQSDLEKHADKKSFLSIINIIGSLREVERIEFGIDDIVRSGIVKSFIIAKQKAGINFA